MNRAHALGCAFGFALVCLVAASATASPPPEEAYLLHCSGCHGPDGAGQPGFIPSLRDVAGLLDAPGGRAYLARVPGVAQAPIGDRELAELLTWVLVELSGAEDMRPYSTPEIRSWRIDPLRDPAHARPAASR